MAGMKRRACAAAMVLALVLAASLRAQDQSPVQVEKYSAPIKLACVGDSITHGVGAGRGQSWPDQVGRLLGEKWVVRNFGVSGTTLLKCGDSPYQRTGSFGNAKSFLPDVVVIALGTNDTKPQNWTNFTARFESDYHDIVLQFADLPSKPRIFICRPPYIAKTGNWGINETNTLEEIPVIDKVAKDLKLGVIDLHAALKGQDAWIPDNVHPNTEGATAMAAAVYQALTGKAAPAPAGK